MRARERSLFPRRGNTGWIERPCVACVTLDRSQGRGTGSGSGILGGHRPSSVCLCQTTMRHFIQMAGPSDRGPQRDASGALQFRILHHSTASTGCKEPAVRATGCSGVHVHFSPAVTYSGSNKALRAEVKVLRSAAGKATMPDTDGGH